jgi:predicted Co/Zn/Cd cation transporter (cation efflux family)
MILEEFDRGEMMKREKNILKLSALGGLFFAVLGIVWGTMINSSMIMFDGLYALISLLLSMLSIGITSYIEKTDFDKFPFGKGMLEPIMVAFHSIVLVIMCSLTFINGIKEFLSGGNSVDADLALGYSLISSIGCAAVYFIMYRMRKNVSSDIVKAENNQWLMDTFLSIGVLGGFVVSVVLEMNSLSHLTRYVDPVMVVISSVVFIRVPVVTLINSFKEIVNSTADEEINDKIYTIVKDIEEEYMIQH